MPGPPPGRGGGQPTVEAEEVEAGDPDEGERAARQAGAEVETEAEDEAEDEVEDEDGDGDVRLFVPLPNHFLKAMLAFVEATLLARRGSAGHPVLTEANHVSHADKSTLTVFAKFFQMPSDKQRTEHAMVKKVMGAIKLKRHHTGDCWKPVKVSDGVVRPGCGCLVHGYQVIKELGAQLQLATLLLPASPCGKLLLRAHAGTPATEVARSIALALAAWQTACEPAAAKQQKRAAPAAGVPPPKRAAPAPRATPGAAGPSVTPDTNAPQGDDSPRRALRGKLSTALVGSSLSQTRRTLDAADIAVPLLPSPVRAHVPAVLEGLRSLLQAELLSEARQSEDPVNAAVLRVLSLLSRNRGLAAKVYTIETAKLQADPRRQLDMGEEDM